MNAASQLSGTIRDILTQPTGGIAGLVESLLAVCQKHGLQIQWQSGCCRFRSFEGYWEELTDVPMRKSVFRAILARLAVLCNERVPNAVPPYGGQCELPTGENSPILLRISFTNTPAEQKLELMTVTVPTEVRQTVERT
jgi:hypothetical protein